MAFWIADTNYPNDELFANYPQQIMVQHFRLKISQAWQDTEEVLEVIDHV